MTGFAAAASLICLKNQWVDKCQPIIGKMLVSARIP
jgi:hypothetical protein